MGMNVHQFVGGGLIILLLTVFLFAAKGPLQGSHWDAPIYLQRSKELIETTALTDYARYAPIIAERLPAYRVETDAYTPYWGFMRLGNAMLLATTGMLMGTNASSIHAAFWLYTLTWLAALYLAAVGAYRISRLFSPTAAPHSAMMATSLAVFLYLVSDVCRYMSGLFIPEVPAMLLLAAAALLFILANERHSLVLGALSGLCGFGLYVVKMDAVWVWLAFLLAFASVLWHTRRDRLWWPAFLASGLSAAGLYGVYSWLYWPMTDPRLLLIFAEAHRSGDINAVAPIKLWFAAGGLLWLGLLCSALYARRSPLLWFSLLWLGLVALPYLDGLLHARPAQVRMYTLIVPALLIGAVPGLVTLQQKIRADGWKKAQAATLMAATLVLALISHGETYEMLRGLPGGWRLQYVKAFLSPPPYERMDFPLSDLQEISQAIYGQKVNTLVIIDDGVPEEYLNIVAYLGPPLKSSSIARFAEPTPADRGRCGKRSIDFTNQQVMFCIEPPDLALRSRLMGEGVRILTLHRLGPGAEGEIPSAQVARATSNLVLLAGDQP